jgi:hypothetical protein
MLICGTLDPIWMISTMNDLRGAGCAKLFVPSIVGNDGTMTGLDRRDLAVASLRIGACCLRQFELPLPDDSTHR